MEILIVGDVHLGAGHSIGVESPGKLNSRLEDKIKLFTWILAKCKEYKVKRLIFTGDIFHDVKPDYKLVEIWLTYLVELENSGIDVHVVYGNHDIMRIGDQYYSALDLADIFNFKHVHMHKKISSVELDDVNLCFAPFRDKRSFKIDSNEKALEILDSKINELIIENKPNLLIGHLTIDGSLYLGDEITDQYNELRCPLSMFGKFEKVWMGHIHKPQEMSPTVSHVGSLDISDYSEIKHNKICVFYDTISKKEIKIEVPTRPFRNLVISVPENFDSELFIKEFLIKENKIDPLIDSILKIEINHHSSISKKTILELLTEYEIHNLAYFVERKISKETAIVNSVVSDNHILVPENSSKEFIEKNAKYDLQFKSDLTDLCLQLINKFRLKD